MKGWMAAMAMFLLVAGCGPKSSERNLQEAYRKARVGDWEQVLALTAPRVKDVPNDIGAKALKSLALLNVKRDDPESMEEAITLMRQAVSASPTRYDYQLAYGWLLLNLERYDEALQPLRAAYDLHIKVDKSKVIGQDVQGTIKYALAVCCMKNHLFDEAIKYFEQSLKSTPYNAWPSIYSNIGCCYVCKKDLQKAMEWMGKAYTKAQENSKIRGADGKLAGPYEDLDAIAVNMAVISDYLSFPNLNRVNSTLYLGPSIQWYAYAESLLRQRLVASQDQEERASIQKQISTISIRRNGLMTKRRNSGK